MPTPANKQLYQRVKQEAKKRFKVWPSAYASGWLVREYKRRGGTYRGSSSRKSRAPKSRKSRSGNLNRWFKEKWIDVCQLPRIVPCGRKRSSSRNYPYCRPYRRISSGTPKTVREISKSELKKRCKRKRRSPQRRIG